VAVAILASSAAISMWGSNISQLSENGGDWAAIDVKKTAVTGGKAVAFTGSMMLPGVREASLANTMLWAGASGFTIESIGQQIEYGEVNYLQSAQTGVWSATTAGVFKGIDLHYFNKRYPLGAPSYGPSKPSSFADLMSEEDALRYNEYWGKKAPNLIAPGTSQLDGQYINNMGRVEPWKAYYDQYGRIIARTDFNAGNISQGIPDTHYHLYDWAKYGQNPYEYGKHILGEYQP
jgi:hypothetical protein